ncbi:hypothetical protein BCR42DRAFT_322603 [Absidia repens]|uniref:Glycosyltransferase 61 catalytic domain-containing protein n=1 Tax=Absidia repens TaxID=90262 RepID=A0A1X2IQ34_9FUNG|nr:hypothetical protein BCR42DRAFT_322603 [Absidia repens]
MAFREDIFKIPLTETDPCLQSVITFNGGRENTTTTTVIGILNRSASRHITNVPELVDSIVNNMPHSQVRLINFDEGCNIRSTAHLVEDVNVLIAPFGNGLGAGLFMKKENAMIISIDARWYSESWFYWPMTSIGIRLYSFQCNQRSCQEYDMNLIKKLSPTISNTDALAVMTQQHPSGVDWSIYGMYQKDVSRRVDVEQFIPFLQEKMASTKYEDCGEMCQIPMERHGFGGSKHVI